VKIPLKKGKSERAVTEPAGVEKQH